ncbi:uncharacterized protein LOC123308076 [Coccinella septempunctata]|uniref:uncharacterized protein LOC123308076 n=1 Tax=Coccinella septempunctata TaxID=41139 RepID=UPI001D0724CF|nr:uncharacterized protein LOC123308076 [Coccinella septempunctata]
MNSRNFLCLVAFLVLAVYSASALKCISCSSYLNVSSATSDKESCATRKDGPSIPCDDGLVCSTIYDPNTSLFTRGCDRKDICKNIPQNCSTCATDLCGSSGLNINPLLAPLLAGLIFAALSR